MDITIEEIQPQYCYIIENGRGCTYNGYTVNLKRRLRQHNGEIKGGAKSTSGRGPWRYFAVVTCEQVDFTNVRALSLEWHIRYPTNKRPRPAQYQQVAGRLRGLSLALCNPKFNEFHFKVFLHEDGYDHVGTHEKWTQYNLNELFPLDSSTTT